MFIGKLAICVTLLCVTLAALGAMQPRPKSAAICSLAIAQEESRLLADSHSDGEARRIAPLAVAASLPQCD